MGRADFEYTFSKRKLANSSWFACAWDYREPRIPTTRGSPTAFASITSVRDALVLPGRRFLHNDHRYETVVLLNRLQAESKLPLLVAGDFEQGVLPARLFDTTVFPHAMAFGAVGKAAYAEEFGRITAQESRAIGVHWNLFPVADVNSNPANPIIGTKLSALTRSRWARWWPPTFAARAPMEC